jgi:hypothetical protein
VGSLLVKIRSIRKTVKRFFYPLALVLSWWSAHFSKSDALYKDRFASDHETADLSTDTLPTDSLILGINHFSRIMHVRATESRQHLGNILIEAPTGGGKGLLAVSQLLTWQGSAVVFDLKGDLYEQTAGYRKGIGNVFRVDTRGYGDPMTRSKERLQKTIYIPWQSTCYMSPMRATARHLRNAPRKC